jgi:predicted nucleic acid-binding protein
LKLVVDSNILFSFFWKGSEIRKIMLSPSTVLFAPKFALRELERHSPEIKSKAGLSTDEYRTSISVMKWFVEFIPLEEYEGFIPEAKRICPDPKDIRFFALALKLDCPVWSDEKRLKRQSDIEVFNRNELRYLSGILPDL